MGVDSSWKWNNVWYNLKFLSELWPNNKNLKKEGPCAVKHRIAQEKKINLNSEEELWVLLHDI